MSAKELERLALMQRIAERRTTQRMVAEQLGLTVRQLERLYAAFIVDMATAKGSGFGGGLRALFMAMRVCQSVGQRANCLAQWRLIAFAVQ